MQRALIINEELLLIKHSESESHVSKACNPKAYLPQEFQTVGWHWQALLLAR